MRREISLLRGLIQPLTLGLALGARFCAEHGACGSLRLVAAQ
jgi:hypothetical protein